MSAAPFTQGLGKATVSRSTESERTDDLNPAVVGFLRKSLHVDRRVAINLSRRLSSFSEFQQAVLACGTVDTKRVFTRCRQLDGSRRFLPPRRVVETPW